MINTYFQTPRGYNESYSVRGESDKNDVCMIKQRISKDHLFTKTFNGNNTFILVRSLNKITYMKAIGSSNVNINYGFYQIHESVFKSKEGLII
jgi:hypothetical protein